VPLNGGTSEWKSVNLEVGMPYFGEGYRVSLTPLIARIGALELIGEYSWVASCGFTVVPIEDS